jgi:hypothetical protein
MNKPNPEKDHLAQEIPSPLCRENSQHRTSQQTKTKKH